MAGFGWSTGDIVLAAKFVVKVGTALRESGGASEDYQQSAQFLFSLEQTLTSLVFLESVLPQDASADMIISQARMVAEILNSFVTSINKFEASLGRYHRKGFRHGMVRKLQWTIFVSGKVKELQSKIALPIATINTNLGLQAM